MTATATATDTRVRMILETYDDAPDGEGLCTKLDRVFASKGEAILHRTHYRLTGYDGRIETLDGTLIESLQGE